MGFRSIIDEHKSALIFGACVIGLVMYVLFLGPTGPPTAEHILDEPRVVDSSRAKSILHTELLQEVEFVRISAGSFYLHQEGNAITSFIADITFTSDPSLATAPGGRITVTSSFWISMRSITAEQYAAFLNHELRTKTKEAVATCMSLNELSDIRFEGSSQRYEPVADRADEPASTVTYEGAQLLCDFLSDASGMSVRLPTEAEWLIAEHAARWSQHQVDSRAWVGNWTADRHHSDLSYVVNAPDSTGPPPDAEPSADRSLYVLRATEPESRRRFAGSAGQQSSGVYGMRILIEVVDADAVMPRDPASN